MSCIHTSILIINWLAPKTIINQCVPRSTKILILSLWRGKLIISCLPLYCNDVSCRPRELAKVVSDLESSQILIRRPLSIFVGLQSCWEFLSLALDVESSFLENCNKHNKTICSFLVQYSRDKVLKFVSSTFRQRKNLRYTNL